MGIGSHESVHAKGFLVGGSKHSWELAGAAPLAMKCPDSSKASQVDNTGSDFGDCKRIKATDHNASANFENKEGLRCMRGLSKVSWSQCLSHKKQ